jgi:hypothetical protein
MAKKKKDICPYCNKPFASLARHKCRIKDHVEGVPEDKTETDRRIERMEETKKETSRTLKKDEKMVLNIISKEKSIYFDELLKFSNKNVAVLENILDTLSLQSKIRIKRELIDSSWTKHVSIVEDYSDTIKIEEIKIDKSQKDFIWNTFNYQPCFICPFSTERCNETNPTMFNPQHCPWLTAWIEHSIEGKIYKVNFEEFENEEQSGI